MSHDKKSKNEMSDVINHFQKELSNLRTGRAHPGILEDCMVEVYGSLMNLKSVATVTAPEPRLLTVTPFDPSTVAQISNALEKSELNLLPAVDGNTIRIPIPQLTEDRRKAIVKQARGKLEEAKISIRDARKRANDSLKKDDAVTEDMARGIEKKIQEHTDTFCKEADALFAKKQKELLTV